MSRVLVRLNGRDTEFEAGTTVAQLVASLARSADGVAVALNDQVISRSRWQLTEVRDHDRVELLGAAQGG